MTRCLNLALLATILLTGPIGAQTQSAHAQTQSAHAQTQSANVLETVTLSFVGPQTSESAPVNPFTDYRLSVVFTNGDHVLEVRGFYAADGTAADTGADSGNVWQCRFTTEIPGVWRYEASLRRGEWIAISDQPQTGESIQLNNASGSIEIQPWPADESRSSPDFRRRGRVVADGHAYRLTSSGQYFLKTGANSPENLLAYVDMDGTYRMSADARSGEAKPTNTLHRYAAHQSDWRDTDPTWGDGKGKSLIGAMNYLASTGMNACYFLTMNIGGDGKDVWPYAKPDDFTRFDCSKLDQWEVLFEHMQQSGILMHVITQETENEKLLDDGETAEHRRLYYSELIARFAHHPALIWNLGEENGPANFSPNGQSTQQEKAMSDYLKSRDPYGNTVLIHSHAASNAQDHILLPLLGHPTLDGVSLQVSQPQRVHADLLKWRSKSAAAGHPWVISMDEIGPAARGAVPDKDDPQHDQVRGPVLWGSLLGGAAGVEWYFGYEFAHNDLDAEDWRSRDALWKQTRIASRFFERHLPFWKMKPEDSAVSGGKAYCLADPDQVYAIYRIADQPDAQLKIELKDRQGTYTIAWLDPIRGGELQSGSVSNIKGGQTASIGSPPSRLSQDWVALVKRAN